MEEKEASKRPREEVEAEGESRKIPKQDDGDNAAVVNDSGEGESESESEEENSVGEENSGDDSKTPSRDPGVKAYEELRKCLRQLMDMSSIPEQNEESLGRIRTRIEKLAELVTSQAQDGEIPNPLKLLQMNLKYILFNSKNIKDVLNIKNFVNSLEDMTANKSDQNKLVYVFLAMHATELWYRWNEGEEQWEWTPEADHWLWMPCSTNVVSDGGWKNEVPAPENAQIIHYLNIVRPLPYDEQYISASYHIAELLGRLKTMGDEEISEQVKKVASAVVSMDNIPAADKDIVVETLKQFDDLLKDS